MTFTRISPVGAPAPVFDEPSKFITSVSWIQLEGRDPRDDVLKRCRADPRYRRWVLACLQVRLSIQADQTFPHPADRRAQVARLIRASIMSANAGDHPT